MQFIRALAYASTTGVVMLSLVLLRYNSQSGIYIALAFFGVLSIVTESVFTSKRAYTMNTHTIPVSRAEHYFSHAVNHIIYPVFFFLSYAYYVYFSENVFVSTAIGVLGVGLYIIFYFLLPRHLHEGHIDSPNTAHSEAKVDILMFVFKLISYCMVHIALFLAWEQSRITENGLFIVSALTTLLYLVLHLNRILRVTGINIFIAILFSVINTLFIVAARVYLDDYSAPIATLFFYLTSGIFYHKLDGTLTYKVMVEYGSLALILSIFIFSN